MLSLPNLWTPRHCLWLPGMPFNPLGRFGVCADCCGEGGDTEVCSYCHDSDAPAEILLSTNVTDDFCEDCSVFDGDFVLAFQGYAADPSSCYWLHAFPSRTCDWDGFAVRFGTDLDGLGSSMTAVVYRTSIHVMSNLIWRGTPSDSCLLWDAESLSSVGTIDGNCNWGTATVTAL